MNPDKRRAVFGWIRDRVEYRKYLHAGFLSPDVCGTVKESLSVELISKIRKKRKTEVIYGGK